MEDSKKKKGAALTAFEWQVLKATMQIPVGETRSYKWVAEKIGRPNAVRAVGQALRKNPYPVIIPCHRVIKSDGNLGWYGGKKDPKKAELIAMEREIAEKLSELHKQSHKGTTTQGHK